MKRHRFNIFPEAKPEDYQRLKQDIEANGFDSTQPIMLYQGEILDGWNRQKACDETGTAPRYEHFSGSDSEAIAYMMRTNKRRNLNSGQWATIAVEAEELMDAIRNDPSKNKGGRPRSSSQLALEAVKVMPEKPVQKIEPVKKDNTKLADHKAAELFNTNRTYISQAAKLKDEAPDIFEKVKAGTMRMTDAAKAVKAIPKDDWRADERERQAKCNAGETVLANASKDQNLIKWAEEQGKAVRIDRGTKYGNPFVLDADGDRDAVCDAYEKHYLPHKPSITDDANKLCGRVLICHCYPLRCHGESLVKLTAF